MSAIKASGNEYVIQVKKNQMRLYQAIEAQSLTSRPHSRVMIEEQDRGSKKTWSVEVFTQIACSLKQQWQGLTSWIVVNKTEIKGGDSSQQRHFYISSCLKGADEFAQGIRGHWGIENKLHRSRDVFFNQDRNRIRTIAAAINMSIFNTLAIQFLVQEVNKSISYAQVFFAQNFKTILQNLRT